MAKKQQTKYKSQAVKSAYQKERKRIQSFIRRAEKRGYTFESGILPSTPKTVTEASVRRLQAITAKGLYEKATFVSPQTGEIVSGRRGRYYEREQAAKKAQETRKQRIYNRLKYGQYPDMPYNEYDGTDLTEMVTHDRHEVIVDKWEEVGNKINNEFPDSIGYYKKSGNKGFFIRLDSHSIKAELLTIWRNTGSEYDQPSVFLNQYVEKNESALADALARLPYDSKEEDVNTHISAIATFLNLGMLSPEDADRLGDYDVVYNEDIGEED